MALHKLPKGYSSDFRLPNKKPVGSVELDLSGLGRYTTFLSVMSLGNLTDLRSGRQPTLAEGVGYRVDNGNMGVDFNLINARLEYDTPVLFDVAKPFSLLWVGQGVETTSNSTVAVLKTADSNGLWLKHSNNSSYQNLTFGGSEDGISTKKAVFSTPVNQVNTYLLTYNGKGDLNANFRIFINDEEGVISDGTNQGNNSNYTVIGNRAFSDASLRGWMGFIATFDADLSLFSKDLINSPYQILKPKQAPIYFTSDAGGGGGTLTKTINVTTALKQRTQNTISIQSALKERVATSNSIATSFKQRVNKTENINTAFRERVVGSKSVSASFKQRVNKTQNITTQYRERVSKSAGINTAFRQRVTAQKSVQTSFAQRVIKPVNVVFDLLQSGVAATVTKLINVTTALHQRTTRALSVNTALRHRVSKTINTQTAMSARVNGVLTLQTAIKQRASAPKNITTSFLQRTNTVKNITFSLDGIQPALTAGASFRLTIKEPTYKLTATEPTYRFSIKG